MAMECISHAYMQSMKIRTVIEIMQCLIYISFDLYHSYDTVKSVILSLIIIKDQFYRGTVTTYRTYRTIVDVIIIIINFDCCLEKAKKNWLSFSDGVWMTHVFYHCSQNEYLFKEQIEAMEL